MSLCETIHMKKDVPPTGSFPCKPTHFNLKGFTRGLVLKPRNRLGNGLLCIVGEGSGGTFGLGWGGMRATSDLGEGECGHLRTWVRGVREPSDLGKGSAGTFGLGWGKCGHLRTWVGGVPSCPKTNYRVPECVVVEIRIQHKRNQIAVKTKIF